MLVTLAALLVAGGLADRAGARRPAAPPLVAPVPVAAPAAALSSSWFCAGATDGPPGPGGTGSGVAPAGLVIADSGDRPTSARVTMVPSAGGLQSATVPVNPHGTAYIPEVVPAGAAWVGAVVDVDAGAVAVSQVVDGPLGRATVPCATSGSSQWYFPDGRTRVNAGEELVLLNPYPIQSIVDVSFSTDQGFEAPVDFQGLTVPAVGLVAVDVGSHLRRRNSIAATVTARTGSVVAVQTSWVTPPQAGEPLVGTPAASAPLADPAEPAPGVSLTLGAPSAGTQWIWPDGLAGAAVDERYVVFNPSNRPATVRLSLYLAQGSAEPLDFSVAAGQAVPVVSEQQARIPAGVPHSAMITTTNGVGIVASRSLTATGAAAPGLPPLEGVGYMLGERLAAPRWIIPAPASDPSRAGAVVVYNPGSGPRTVSIAALTATGPVPLPGATLQLPGGSRNAMALPPGLLAPVIVGADGPVFVEYDLYGMATRRHPAAGVSLSSAVPLS